MSTHALDPLRTFLDPLTSRISHGPLRTTETGGYHDAEIRNEWHAPLSLFIHVAIGTLIWAGLAVPAIGLDLLATHLKADLAPFIFWALRAVSYTIQGIDMLLFCIYLIRSSWRSFRQL